MKRSLSNLRRLHALNRHAPLMCLAALLVAGFALSRHDSGDRGQALARARVIRSSLAEVPYVSGDWVGADCPLPAGATEILMPTAVLSRRFTELGTSRQAMLGIIHCGDVRDMHGHYPPSCYPSSGWRPRDTGHDTIRLSLGDESFDAKLYRFSSVDSGGSRREVSVVGFFVLPDGTVTSEMEALRARAAKLEISKLGVGQIQVVMDGWPMASEVVRVAQSLLDLVPRDCIGALKGQPIEVTQDDSAGRRHSPVRLEGVSDAEIDRVERGGRP